MNIHSREIIVTGVESWGNLCLLSHWGLKIRELTFLNPCHDATPTSNLEFQPDYLIKTIDINSNIQLASSRFKAREYLSRTGVKYMSL